MKRLLPRSLLGRSVLIIVMPLILVQLVATWVFYDRHWDTVSRRLLRLEKDLENLSRTIPAVRDVLQLRKHSFPVPCRRTKTDRIQMIASPTSSVLHLRNPSRRT